MPKNIIKNKLLKNKLLKNISWVFSAKVISMFAFLLTDMIIARILGKSSYGEWAYFYSIISIVFYIFWFGINQSSKVFVSKGQNAKERNVIIKTSLACRCLFSTFFFILFLSICKYLANYLGYPDKYPNLLVLLRLGCLIAFGNSILEYAKQVNIGTSRYKVFFICNIFEFISIMLVVSILLFFKPIIFNVGLGYAIANMLVAVCILLFFGEQTLGSKINFQSFWNIIKYALPLSLLGIGGLLMVEMDTLMLGIFSTSEQVAIYAIAKSLATKASQVNFSITSGTIQEFAQLTEQNIVSKRKQFNAIVKWNIIVTLGICFAFFVFSNLFITLIYGMQYKESVFLIYILMPYYFLLSVSNLYSNFLDYQGKANFRLLFYFVTIAINLILNIILIQQYGAFGAAIASGLALVPYSLALIICTYRVFDNYIVHGK